MLKTVQSYIRPGRVSFFFGGGGVCFCTCSLQSLALHLQSTHVSYAGDCTAWSPLQSANIGVVRCSTFASTWQVGASRSVPRKRSKPKRKEAHAVDLPAFFVKESCRYCLSLHHTCGKRSGWKHSAEAPRMHVTGESFAIRVDVSHLIEPKRK